jgi:hypothetical protein
MSNTFEIITKGSLFRAEATWNLEIDDDRIMLAYQNYANDLVALSVAKLGEYAMDLIDGDADALKKGYKSIASAISEA